MNGNIEETKTETKENKKTPFVRSVYDWVEVFVVSVAIVFIIFSFVARIAIVDGGSMLPTLTGGDKLVVRQILYTPKQGDIIVCQSKSYGLDKPLVKRVIATEGQTVTIDRKNWKVYVNGEPLVEDYIYREGEPMRGMDGMSDTVVVEPGHVFVMGDHRNDSLDSRSILVGQIDERYIIGKVIFRFMPLSGFGRVK